MYVKHIKMARMTIFVLLDWRNVLILAVSLFLFSASTSAATGDNVALSSNGTIATQSSYYSASWPASNCTNGVTVSSNNAQLCHSRGEDNGWWDLELVESVPIDSIVVYNRTSCCSNRILNMYVLVSDTAFPSGNDAASLIAARAQATFEYQITADAPITTIALSDLVGQYVRLQKAGPPLNSSSTYNLLEIQVFEGRRLVDLTINKLVSDSTPNIGDVLTFSLEVTNLSTNEASNASITDSVPAGFGSITNISNGGSLLSSGMLSWIIPSIAANETITLTFNAVVLSP